MFEVGARVVKNPRTWKNSAGDDCGRGEGVGEIVAPSMPLREGSVEVRWPSGRSFEYVEALLPEAAAAEGA